MDTIHHWKDYNRVSPTMALRLAVLLAGSDAITLGTDPSARLMYVHRDRQTQPITPSQPPEPSERTVQMTVHLHPEILGLGAFACLKRGIEPAEMIHKGLSVLEEVSDLPDYVPGIVEGDPLSDNYTTYPIDPLRGGIIDQIQAK